MLFGNADQEILRIRPIKHITIRNLRHIVGQEEMVHTGRKLLEQNRYNLNYALKIDILPLIS